MLRRWLSFGCVWVLMTSVMPLMAADSPLEVFTQDAAVVVRLKNVKGTTGKIAKLADSVVKGTGQQVQFGAGAIGALIHNATLEGVDLSGDFYVAVYIDKGSEPGLAFGIPASDLDTMKEALGDEVTFIPVGEKYAVYTTDDELGDALKEQAGAEEGGLDEAIDKGSAAVFGRGDLSVFVNVPSLLETFADEIAMAQGALESIGSQEIPEGAIPGVNGQEALKLGMSILQGALQFVLDHEGITIGVAVGDKDVVIEEYFKVGDESETAKFLAANPGSDMKILGQLPAGATGYFGAHGNISGFMDWAFEAAKVAMTDEEGIKALEGMAADMKGLKFGSVVGSFSLTDGKNGLVTAASVTEVNDPKKLQNITKKYGASVANAQQNGLTTTITVKAGAEKVGSTSIDVTTMKYEADEDNPAGAQAMSILQIIYGGDEVTSRQAYLKDKVVQTLAGSKADMEALLKSLEGTAARGNPVEATRAKLGTKANFIGLIDLANLTIKGMTVAGSLAPLPIPDVSGLSVPPSYIGASVTLEESAISVKTVVPVEQIQAISKVVIEVGKAAQEQ